MGTHRRTEGGMNVGIIGATGNAGRAIFAEAVGRGHEATAIVRHPEKARELLGGDVPVLDRDAFALVREDLVAFDVVVDAFSTAPAQAYRHLDLAARVIGLLRETTAPRLVFIVGAGSLMTGEDHHLLVEDLRKAPEARAWIATPESQLKELRFLEWVDNVEWVAVSPSETFVPGEAGEVVLGRDELLVAPDGASRVTTGTMAMAILDEIERPAHRQERFTVRDA
nr:NAD(P)H-binding protein [Baekduia sp.]